jgi:hypothetical protein
MHTGIAAMALPLSGVYMLTTTSKYCNIVYVMYLPVPLL